MDTIANITFEDWEAEQMKDPLFRRLAEALESDYRAARVRIMCDLAQEEGSMNIEESAKLPAAIAESVVPVETLKPGDIVVLVWHDAAEWRDCPAFFSPENIGQLGVRRLLVGIVITNGDGWLRVAETLTYLRDKEEREQTEIRNTYYEVPWSWLDKVLLCGCFEEMLFDVWEKAGECGK